MIKRDRNHPSLVIYNLHNERGAWPQVQDYAQMRMAHSLDPTRILTYNSSNGENPENEANARFKLALDAKRYYFLLIMDGMTGIMQVVRVAIMIIYIGVKITITVFQIIRMRLFIGGKTGLLVLRRVFSSFGMKSCNLALLLDGKRWII